MDRIKNIKIWKGTAKYVLIQRFIWREESQVKFLEKMQAGMTLKAFQVSLKKKEKKNETNIVIYRFNATQTKIATPSFSNREKTAPKFIWGYKRAHIDTAILRNTKYCWKNHHSWFQACYRAKVIRSLGHWHKTRHREQWSRIEGSGINPLNYNHLILSESNSTQHEKKTILVSSLLLW